MHSNFLFLEFQPECAAALVVAYGVVLPCAQVVSLSGAEYGGEHADGGVGFLPSEDDDVAVVQVDVGGEPPEVAYQVLLLHQCERVFHLHCPTSRHHLLHEEGLL